VNNLQRTYPFLIAAIVIVAIGAPIAQGTGRADPVAALSLKVKALQARIASLEAKSTETSNALASARSDIATASGNLGATQQSVTSLQAAVTSVQSSVACVRYGTVPIKRYTGYMYTNNAGATVGVTTALDIVESGQTPGGYVALVNPTCVGTAFALRQAIAPAVTR
jgi:hypothetical protein